MKEDLSLTVFNYWSLSLLKHWLITPKKCTTLLKTIHDTFLSFIFISRSYHTHRKSLMSCVSEVESHTTEKSNRRCKHRQHTQSCPNDFEGVLPSSICTCLNVSLSLYDELRWFRKSIVYSGLTTAVYVVSSQVPEILYTSLNGTCGQPVFPLQFESYA